MKRYNASRDRQISFIVGVATFCAVAAANVSAATIKGNVRYSGTRVEKKTFPVTIDQYLCGKEKEAGDLVLSSANGIRNVVVSLQRCSKQARKRRRMLRLQKWIRNNAYSYPGWSSSRSAAPWSSSTATGCYIM